MDDVFKRDWVKIDSILDAVLDAEQSDREQILIERCGGNTLLAERVRELLIALANENDLLEDPRFEDLGSLEFGPVSDIVGSQLDKYSISRLLGQGGMGSVYLGTRNDGQFHQDVAIKLISRLYSDSADLAGFKRERQILAKLKHPAIASLLDGGTTNEGTPYLVMEYVDGVSVTEYCRSEKPSVRQRIDLFLKICDAVKYAHQNLIIHRDLKPANILVTKDGNPKLLDFGVAKLLNPQFLDVTTDMTIGANILTPNYASPEQLKGEDITTASDVYSLGVILYEMLTGQLPLDLKSKSLPDILRMITEESPMTPSLAVSHIESGSKIAPEPLRGDLDTIVLKALAKERRERYQTVEALVSDLNRHLNNLPILARPHSAVYKFSKFTRRYRTAFVSGCVIAGLLLILIAGTLWSASAARSQALTNLRQAYSSDMNLAMQAYETANLNQLNQLLARYENTDFRGWEWNFLRNLLHPKGRIASIEHPAEVWNVTFSPDSTKMATAWSDGFARIYSVPGGELLSTTSIQEKNIWRLAFSPDGRRLATASGDSASTSAKIWDVETGAEVLSLVGHTSRVRAIGFSPDGKLVATGSRDGTVRIWSAERGSELKELITPSDGRPLETHDLQFTSDNGMLITANNNGATIWDLSTGLVLRNLNKTTRPNEQQPALSVAISRDGTKFALGRQSSSIQIFDLASGRVLIEIGKNTSKVNDIAFSPDGKLIAAASSDRTLRFFETERGTEVQNIRVHSADSWSVDFSPDGKYFASSGTDFRTFIFDSAEILDSSSFGDGPGYGGNWSSISADRRTVTTIRRALGKFEIYDLGTKTIKATVAEDRIDVQAFSPDGSVIAGALENNIAFWNATDGVEIMRFKAHEKVPTLADSVRALKFSADGKLLISGGNDGFVRIWNAQSTDLIRELYHFDSYVSSIAISPDSKSAVAASYDLSLKLFNLQTGEMIADLGKQSKAILSAEFAPDGRSFVTGGADGVIKIWHASDGELLDTLTGNAGFVYALTFTPDGRRLASASGEGVIRLYDTETKAQVLAIRTNSAVTSLLAFTPDGHTLISHGSQERIRLWDATPRGK